MRRQSIRRIAKPKAGLQRPYPKWPMGAEKMVSIPSIEQETTQRMFFREGRRSLVPLFAATKQRPNRRFVIALVKRTGPNDFVVLNKAVAPYPEPNPGERILGLLAKEFGLSEYGRLILMKRGQVKGL